MDVRPPTGDGRRFDLHVFVCTEGPNCPADGPAVELLAHWKKRFKQEGASGTVRFNKAGCLDQCGHGPVVAVYPEGVWYAHLDIPAADRIFDEHIIGGNPVEELIYRSAAPGKNKLPMAPGETPDTSHPLYKPCNRCPWGPSTAPETTSSE